jgi:hypothetical protein
MNVTVPSTVRNFHRGGHGSESARAHAGVPEHAWPRYQGLLAGVCDQAL